MEHYASRSRWQYLWGLIPFGNTAKMISNRDKTGTGPFMNLANGLHLNAKPARNDLLVHLLGRHRPLCSTCITREGRGETYFKVFRSAKHPGHFSLARTKSSPVKL
jgi:hypothetical protein